MVVIDVIEIMSAGGGICAIRTLLDFIYSKADGVNVLYGIIDHALIIAAAQ